ncbi:MAG: hypothetical protein HY321_01380 [Armatimonadetes bacterium]|nr:hypothetical protein [Armatimonadota bacterium]
MSGAPPDAAGAPSTQAPPPTRPSDSRPGRRFRLGLDGLYIWIALALTALKPLLTPVPPYDFWWHMAFGRWIARERQIPVADVFSFTRAGEPFHDQSWLAQVLLYGLHQIGGVPLLILFQACVVTFTYGLLLWLAIRLTGRTRLAVALLLLAVEPISYDNWQIRPQSYALPLFAAFLVTLTGYRLRWWRRLWPLAPLMALWANLHGSFALGLALIGLVLAGEGVSRWRGDDAALSWPEWRRLAAWGGICALAALANPRGPAIAGYVAHLLRSPAVTRLITEWGSPTPRDAQGALFYLVVIVLFVALTYARRRPRLTDMALIIPFLWLALSAGRNVVWFAMVALPPLAAALASRLPPPRPGSPGSPALNAAVAVVVGGLLLLALPWVKPRLGLPPKLGALIDPETPVAAVAFLRSLPDTDRPRRLFHELGAGSYLIWAAPEQRVFVDPRIELYPYEQVADYIRLGGGDRVEEIFSRYAFDGLLLSVRGQAELARRMRGDARWRTAYHDRAAVLFLPAGGRGAPGGTGGYLR